MRVLKEFLLITAVSWAAGAVGCHASAQAKLGGTEPTPPTPATVVAEPPPPPPKKTIALKGVRMKSPTQIDMPGDIEYQTGSAKILLNDKSKKVLTLLAQILKDNPEITKLRIEGHTDNQGESTGFDNNKLSKERADSVAEWLTKNGIDAKRLDVVGWGSQHPITQNDSPEHMALNRRTEFHVEEFNGKPLDRAHSAH